MRRDKSLLGQVRRGFHEGSVSVLFGNSGVNENEAIYTGGGHECKEFGMFEAVKAVDVEVYYSKVVFEPRVPVMIEFERLGIKVKEVEEGCGPERVSVLLRF